MVDSAVVILIIALTSAAGVALDGLGERRDDAPARAAARDAERAVELVLSKDAGRTPDLGGPLGTRAFAAELCHALEQIAQRSA